MGKHAPTDRQVNFWCPVILYARFQKRAKELGLTVEDIFVAYMTHVTKEIELTEEEYDQCIKRIQRNVKRNH